MIRRVLFAVALSLVCTTTALAAGKIGVANLAMVSGRSEVGQAAEKEMETHFGKERKELEAQAAAIGKKNDELKTQAAALSEQARNTKIKEIEAMAKKLDEKAAAYSQRVGAVQQQLTMQMQEILMIACSDYAKKNGYDIILDSNALAYASDAVDVGPALIEEINRVWKEKGGKFKVEVPKK